jgi:hypothetical protein
MLQPIGNLGDFPADIIKAEPMLYSADPSFARENGGPITQQLLDQLVYDPDDGHVVIDTRVHMLKPGWYPAIPGWHLDAIERGADGQPDLQAPRVKEHRLFIADAGTGSTTEVLHRPLKGMPQKAAPGETLWGTTDRWLRETWDPVFTTRLKSGMLYHMGAGDYHRAVPATGHGWRFFFRATIGYPRAPHNELRRQVNVYMPAINGGW